MTPEFWKKVSAALFVAGVLVFSAGSAAARTFFVNAVDGNDANTGTSAETAWKSIPRINSAFYSHAVQAGDTVAFRRGDTFTGFLDLAASGKPGRPVVIGAYGTGASPVIDAVYQYYGVSVQGSYIVIGDLRVANARSAAFRLMGGYSRITLRDCSLATTIYVDTPVGVLFGEGACSNIAVERVTLGGCKDSGFLVGAGTRVSGLSLDTVSADSACYGFHAERARLTGLRIRNSSFSHSLNSGIRMERTLVSDLDIRDTVASHNRVNGVYLNGDLKRVLLSGLTIDGNGGHGLNIDTFSAENIAVEKCRMTGSQNRRNGFSLDGKGRDCRVTDSVSSRNNGDGFNVHGSWKDVILVQCAAEENGNDGRRWDGDGYTFHDDSTGRLVRCTARNNRKSAVANVNQSTLDMDRCIFTHETNGTVPLVYLQGKRFSLTNSVVYSAAQAGTGLQTREGEILVRNTIVQGFDTGFENRGAALTQDHNIVFGAKTPYKGIDPGAGSLVSDPLFTDPSRLDFTLSPYSPAIDAGADTVSREDFAGRPVPNGKAPDIGAFETTGRER